MSDPGPEDNRPVMPFRNAKGAARRSPGPVNDYDFRDPDKFSKDHIRSIQTIQEGFARAAGNFLASQSRTAVRLEAPRAEQLRFGAFLERLQDPLVLLVSQIEPLGGIVCILLDAGVALRLVDRLLGGSGDAARDRPLTQLTEVEKLLFESLGRGLFNELTRAWEQIMPLQGGDCEVALLHNQFQGLHPNEVVLAIEHETQVLQHAGKLLVLLPATTLEPLLPRLNARVLFSTPRASSTDELGRRLETLIEQAPLRVRVRMGTARAPVADLLRLEPGDIIRFDVSVHSPMQVLVEDRPCFVAYPGQRAGNLAIRIVDRIRDEDDDPPQREGMPE